MRAKEFDYSSDVIDIVDRLGPNLERDQMIRLSHELLNKKYGTSTAYVMVHRMADDLIDAYLQRYGRFKPTWTEVTGQTRVNTVAKKRQSRQKKTTTTDNQEIQNKINDLSKQIQKAEWRVEIGTEYLRKYQQQQYGSSSQKLQYAEVEEGVLFWTKQLIELKNQLAKLTNETQ